MKKPYYVGLSAIAEHAVWKWETGEVAFKNEIFWVEGDPRNRVNEECGSLMASWFEGRWAMFDVYCNTERFAICEIKNEHCK